MNSDNLNFKEMLGKLRRIEKIKLDSGLSQENAYQAGLKALELEYGGEAATKVDNWLSRTSQSGNKYWRSTKGQIGNTVNMVSSRIGNQAVVYEDNTRKVINKKLLKFLMFAMWSEVLSNDHRREFNDSLSEEEGTVFRELLEEMELEYVKIHKPF